MSTTGTSANATSASGSGGRQQNPISTQTYKIITQYGDMTVVKQGVHVHSHHHHHHHQHQHHSSNHQPHQQASGSQTPSSQQLDTQQQQQQQQQSHSTRPVIMTFHDLGLNSELQFATFCETDEVKLMLQTFTMIHVNFIGQESNNSHDEDLADDFRYPNVEQMAECIVDVCTQLRVRSFIALAVGAGAYIVSSLALMRPDLVHGLFLINPIISSCSITEWLYFKMSAIASNHYIGGSNNPSSASSDTGSAGQHSTESPKKHRHQTGGFRKLLEAAHIHIPHHHHHHHHHNHQQQQQQHHNTNQQQHHNHHQHPDDKDKHSNDRSDESRQDGESLASLAQSTASQTSEAQAGDESHTTKGSGSHGPPTSRLRKLILSRNFRLNQQTPSHEVSERPSAPVYRSGSFSDKSENHLRESNRALGHKGSCGSSESIGAGPSLSSAAPNLAPGDKLKRPPGEYLMYHHFGSATIQRYRRPSADANHSLGSDSPELSVDSTPDRKLDRQSNSSRHSSQSQDSLAAQTKPGSGKRRNRSSSIACLSAHYLASFSSERQRAAYMQSVYKQYFSQINAHNLWLFAHSFVKRRALSLRKDCGAAAHAAAAAAALGTSIYTAFVGIAPAQTAGLQAGSSQQQQQQTPQESQQQAAAIEQAAPETRRSSGGATEAPAQQQQQSKNPHALVAGTKVKRTFTCQTLIMCSSVPIHCERAFKLMALLNPLQATCIKTDQLLVLEEKPEKVCRALRLFLQGIGYSMSTYERRLRLSSAQGSISSADSTSSARSLSEKV